MQARSGDAAGPTVAADASLDPNAPPAPVDLTSTTDPVMEPELRSQSAGCNAARSRQALGSMDLLFVIVALAPYRRRRRAMSSRETPA